MVSYFDSAGVLSTTFGSKSGEHDYEQDIRLLQNRNQQTIWFLMYCTEFRYYSDS